MGCVSSPHFHGTYLPINQSTLYRPAPEPPSKKKRWPDTDTLKKTDGLRFQDPDISCFTARKCFKTHPETFH